MWFWDNAVTIGTLVMAAAAIIALIYAHWQISENRRAERRGNANELWRETLRLGFDNPKLSDPTLKPGAFDYDKLTIDVWTNGSVTASDAVSLAAKLVRDHLNIFINVDEVDLMKG